MRFCGEFADDLAMSAMHAVKNTDCEPGVFLDGNFFKRIIMLHGMKKAAALCIPGERPFIYVISELVCEENFLGLPLMLCHLR